MNKVKKQFTCIVCPLGCNIEVTLDGKDVVQVKGNSCPRGEEYVRSECSAPLRTLTTTVRCGGRLLPVRTNRPVPKELLFDCMAELSRVNAKAPVRAGDVILADLLGTGADVIASSDMM